MSSLFKPPFWKPLQIVLCLVFALLEFRRSFLYIRCIVVVTSLGIGKSWAKNTGKSNVLKTIISPSRVRILCLYILKTFSIPIIVLLKFVLVQYFYYRKKIPEIFIASLVKSMHLMPQTASVTRFRSPIPATLYFDKFDFNLKTMKIKQYSAVLLLNPNFKKKIVSSA